MRTIIAVGKSLTGPLTQVCCLAAPNLTSSSLGVAMLPPRGTRAESPAVPVKSVGGRVRHGPGARQTWVQIPALPLINK